MIRRVLFVSLLFSLTACVSKPKKIAEVQDDRVTVMTLNVENLFDTIDDPDKNDEAFLPLAQKKSAAMKNRCRFQNNSEYRALECMTKDWSTQVFDRKLRRLTDILAQVEKGYGPDILILQEVENRYVLELWRERYLKHMNYQTIAHIEGPDERGIDTAIMSRLPLVGEPKLHVMDYSMEPELAKEKQRPTRGILEAHLKMPDGTEAAVFSLHFPSQGAPTIHRKVAVQNLLNITEKVPASMPIIIGGDFNITSTEEWKQKYFKDMLQPKFAVSHMIGCDKCTGTTYWWRDNTWSFFDAILFSKDMDGLNSPWQVDRKSIKLITTSRFQWDHWGSPANFKSGKGSVGVTDHLPVYAEILYVKPQNLGATQ